MLQERDFRCPAYTKEQAEAIAATQGDGVYLRQYIVNALSANKASKRHYAYELLERRHQFIVECLIDNSNIAKNRKLLREIASSLQAVAKAL